MTPQQMMFLNLTVHHQFSTIHLTLEHYLLNTPLTLIYTWRKKKMKKRIFKPFHWMMNTGLLKKSLTDHCAYMNIHYHMDYAHTSVHIWITRPPPSYFKTMDLSDISEFKDVMTTSSDEDILALKDIAY